MLAIFLLAILLIFLISIIDHKFGIIPHTLTVAYGILGIVYCILDNNFKFWFTLLLIIVIFIPQLLLFSLSKAESIGGGDVKILTLSMLFLHTYKSFVIYCTLLIAASIIGLILFSKKGCLRYGPYITIPVIIVLGIVLYNNLLIALYIACINILAIEIVSLFIEEKEGCPCEILSNYLNQKKEK